MTEELNKELPEQEPEEVTNEEPVLDEFEVDMIGPLEYIQAAYFAFAAVEDIDIEILPSEAAKRRIRRIKFKSIRIIDDCINELYSDIFGDDENSD